MNTKLLALRVLPAAWLLAAVLIASAAHPVSQADGHPALSPQETLTLYAVADATVRRAAPNTNFGGEHTLEVMDSDGFTGSATVEITIGHTLYLPLTLKFR